MKMCDQVRFKPACSAREAAKPCQFDYSIYRYNTVQGRNNKDVDQTAHCTG